MPTINSMFVDGFDHNGLMYWYDEAKKINESLKSKK